MWTLSRKADQLLSGNRALCEAFFVEAERALASKGRAELLSSECELVQSLIELTVFKSVRRIHSDVLGQLTTIFVLGKEDSG